jgi:tetratricopeptide (TPR) repeat protein
LALIYHLRALTLRQLPQNIDPKLVAINLLGIANAYWGQQNLSEALIYAKQALTLNQSIESGNDPNIAANLAVLANIYHYSGDDMHALELVKQALVLIEHNCVSPDSSSLVLLLNNIGIIQVSAGLLDDALLTFIRVLHICERTLPEGHSKRVIIESNIKQITEMQKDNIMNSFSHFDNFLTKFLLL